ncbi:MAG: 50S ribosomal protein L21 [bacterium]|nr:50S ribosomal protein L21 [bacterium]
MYAIGEVAGAQIKLIAGTTVRVPKLSQEVGSALKVEKILMSVADDGSVKVGTPYLEGSADATVVDHLRDPKIFLLHKKRRKGYIKQGGHKQPYSMIRINAISL